MSLRFGVCALCSCGTRRSLFAPSASRENSVGVKLCLQRRGRGVAVLKDESSRFEFEETLEYARRAGITVFCIGFRLTDPGARRKLANLADETGGRSFFIRDIADLEGVYSTVQKELRSQYLIAYQSTNTAKDGKFRSVELDVDMPGVEVKTLSGYYP